MGCGRISLDTETTGKDIRHGVLPFFVSSGNLDGEVKFWEWLVDPLSRKPNIPKNDIEELNDLVNDADEIVFHNAKFDIPILQAIGVHASKWPWKKVIDTTYYCHLLANTEPKDLATAAAVYLGESIEQYEIDIDDATKEARAIAKKQFPGWVIAGVGVPSIPSQKEKFHKCDMWLPRRLALELNYPPDHYWHRVLREYGAKDAHCTVFLAGVQEEMIETRDLTKIAKFRQQLPEVIERMESVGVSVSGERVAHLQEVYKAEVEELSKKCIHIASTHGMKLTIPKSGNNKSLIEFVFSDQGLGLEPISCSDKTGAPSLDKQVIEQYLSTLPPGSEALEFLECLSGIRKRGTSIGYMESYERFWLPTPHKSWYRLYPSLNGVGSNTLRFTSQNPNEQNISKKGMKGGRTEGKSIRWAFGPTPGREWWSFDARNIELRLPVYECQEEEMMALFERPDDPPYYGSNHLLIFHTLHPDLWEKAVEKVGWENAGEYCKKTYKDTWYQRTKNGNFAVQYGAIQLDDGVGTADIAYGVPGAQRLIKSRFAKQEQLNQKWVQFAKKTGLVETMPDKTIDPKHGYPLFCTKNRWGGTKETVPLNYRVQGTAMWWMTKAMVRTDNFLNQLNNSPDFFREFTQKKVRFRQALGYHMIMQVHDELVFDFPFSYCAKTNTYGNYPIVKEIARLMEEGGNDIGVPTPVSCEYHIHNWGEGVSVDLSV